MRLWIQLIVYNFSDIVLPQISKHRNIAEFKVKATGLNVTPGHQAVPILELDLEDFYRPLVMGRLAV